jgi:hypothetical protein
MNNEPTRGRLLFNLKTLMVLFVVVAVMASSYAIGRKTGYKIGYHEGKTHAEFMSSSGTIQQPFPGYLPID